MINMFVTTEDLVQHYHINRIYVQDKLVRIIMKSTDGILPWLLADIPIRYLATNEKTIGSWYNVYNVSVKAVKKDFYLQTKARHKLINIAYNVAGKLVRDLDTELGNV